MTLDVNRVVAAAIEAAFEENRHRRGRFSGVTTLAAGVALATVARAATQKKLPRIAELAVEKLADIPNLNHLSDAVRDRLADHGLLRDDEDDQSEPEDAWDEADDDEDETDDEEDEADDDEDEGYGDGQPSDDDDQPPEGEAEEDWDEDEDSEDDEQRDEGEEDDEPRDQSDEDEEPSNEDDGEPEAEGDWDDEADEDEQESEPGIELGSENGGAAQRASRGFEAASQRGRGRGGAPELMQVLVSHSPPPALRGARRQDPVKRPPEPGPRTQQDDARSERTPRARSSNSKRNSNSKRPADRKQKAARN